MAYDVLIVDDYPAIRQVVRAALGPDIRLEEAGDWNDARRRLSRHAGCRVVLLDIGLPGAPDPEVMLGDLRRLAPEAAVIVVTGRDQGALETLRAHPGVTAILTKPFDLAVLRRQVRQLLGEGRSGRQDTTP